MKNQNAFVVLVLALVSNLIGCGKATPTQERIQPAPEKTVMPTETPKPADGIEECKAKQHEAFARLMESYALHLVEDKTVITCDCTRGFPHADCPYPNFVGYVRDDHDNCFYTSYVREVMPNRMTLATVPCDSLVPKK